MEEKKIEAFEIADTIISSVYPGEVGMWGTGRIPNYGILRATIAHAIIKAYNQGVDDGTTKRLHGALGTGDVYYQGSEGIKIVTL